MKLELLKLCDYLYMTTSVGLLPYYVIIKFYSILSYWDITFNYLFPAHVAKHGGVFCYHNEDLPLVFSVITSRGSSSIHTWQ